MKLGASSVSEWFHYRLPSFLVLPSVQGRVLLLHHLAKSLFSLHNTLRNNSHGEVEEGEGRKEGGCDLFHEGV